jgi:hypothetical protein
MWALFAVGALAACGVCYLFAVASDDKKGTQFFGFLAFVAGIGGLGCAAIALIRFVKWVWT